MEAGFAPFLQPSPWLIVKGTWGGSGIIIYGRNTNGQNSLDFFFYINYTHKLPVNLWQTTVPMIPLLHHPRDQLTKRPTSAKFPTVLRAWESATCHGVVTVWALPFTQRPRWLWDIKHLFYIVRNEPTIRQLNFDHGKRPTTLKWNKITRSSVWWFQTIETPAHYWNTHFLGSRNINDISCPSVHVRFMLRWS